ncbi:MAG: hypothetical protein, partial [Olavius algarvensis Gamma 1 endosymbiont]
SGKFSCDSVVHSQCKTTANRRLCRLRNHSRITHYPFTRSLQKLPL